MRRMVCPDNGYPAVSQGTAQRLTVSFRLHRWVAFDTRPKANIVFICEKKMGYDSLGGYLRHGVCPWVKQRKLTSRGDMGDMQARIMPPRKPHSQLCRTATCLLATNFRMMFNCRVVTIFCLGLAHIVIDYARILAMSHHRHRCCREDFFQRFGTVNKHVAR